MVCKSCGEKSKNTAKDFTKAVVEINNPEKLVLFRKVVVPASMGTEEDFPASVGKYYNVLLQYEANGDTYLYSSDGIPTMLSSDVSELQHQLEQLGIKVDGEILARISGDNALSNAIAGEKTARENADTALGNRITALDGSLATVAKTGNYNDLTNKPTIGNATLTVKRNNANVGTFTANATTDKSINISVPTKTSDITNDGSDGSSTYVENDELSAVATSGSYNDLSNKPTIGNATLTIKKNNTSVGTFTANATSNKSIDITVPTKTSELTNNGSDNTSTYVEADELATVATTGSYPDLHNKPTIGNGTLTIQRNSTQLGTFKANATSGTTVDISVPTKTSDLANDGADGTSTFVETDDLPVVDTTYSASSNNAIANSTVTNSLNRDVMTNLTLDTSPSTTTVNLNNTKTNLASPSSTTTTAITLPVASSTQAGVMNSSTFDAVTNNTNNINALLSGAVAVTGLPASPSQSDITTAWQTETGLSTLINRASVYDVTNNKVWTYYTNDATWHAASNTSQVTVNTFTNSSEGVIKGSTNTGQVFAENDGTGSVNGWDTLTGTVANHTSKLATIEQGAEVNVQSNWTQTNTSADDYIKNKPANLVQDANYVHTDNNFTTTLKNKLNGIESGAEVNQNAFSNVSVNGVTVAADAKTDTLTLTAGNNVTLTGDASNDTVTISSTDTNTTYSFANGTNGFTVTPSGGSAQTITVTPSIADATTSASGLMSAADKTEFDLSNRVQRRIIGDGTTIPDNSDLNTIPFLSVGRYVIQGSVHASTLINTPTAKSFAMEVANYADSVLDNEATGRYIYRVRRITTYDGDEYKQYVHSGGTAGVFTYGSWLKIATTSDIPTVNNATLTIQKNGTNVQTFTANSSTNKTANITVPTAVSELTNDANYATTTQLNNGLATKQNTLTAGNAIDITNDVISADVYPADFFTNATETTSDTGTDIALTNTAFAPLASVTPKGDTEQTTYTGKNLFDINGTQQANTRCTATIDGNAITVTSTAASTGFYSIILPNSDDLFGKTVTISFGSVDSNHKGKVNIYEALQSQPNSVGGWVTAINAANIVSGGHQTFTFPDSHTGSYDSFAVVLYVGNQAGSTAVGDYTTYSGIQIEAGSTATDYEPYVGGTAAPNPNYPENIHLVSGEQTVKVTGWQLCPGLDDPDVVHYNDAQTTYTPLTTGWCRIGYVSDSSFHNISIYDAEKYIKPDTVYTTIVELNNVINPGNATYIVLQSHNQSAYGDATYLGKIGDAVVSGTSIRTSSNGYGAAAWTATSKDAASLTGKPLLRSWIGSHLASGDSWDIRVSIIEGDHASDWQDYCDKRWQPYQSQEYKVNLGKNLFNKNDYGLFSGYFGNSDTTVGSPGYQRNRLIYMPCQPNTKYSITLPPTTEFGLTTRVIANMTVAPVQGAEVRNAVRNVNMSVLNGYTTDSTANYLVFFLQAPDGTNMDDIISDIVSYIQVEKGSTATEYAPYFEPIELCKIGDYQDYIYKSGGNWYKHESIKKVVLDGSETWVDRQYGGHTYGISPNAQNPLEDASHSGTAILTLSKYFTPVSYSERTNNIPNSFYINQDAFRIEMRNTAWATVSDFTTWLSTHNTTVYYVLATATDTQITDTDLIAQLEELANANSYRGTTHIDTASDGYNLPMILTAEVFTNTLVAMTEVIDGKQNKLTAGSNITITNNTISATDTTYSTMTGATSGSAGASGLVPAPSAGDQDKVLKGDGTWGTVSTGSAIITMTSTDPGEGQPLQADHFIAVYEV